MQCPTVSVLNIDALDWDERNVPHVEQRGYSPADAEFICFGEQVYYAASYKNRRVILGPARDGRILAVILGRVPNRSMNVYSVFSLRPAKRKERAFYVQRNHESTD